jgi:hypothetical protein
MIRRKPRCDSNYVIYRLFDGKCDYIGLTRKTESTPLKSVKRRLTKHLSRAKDANIDWAFYEYIRNSFDSQWKIEIIEIIRGRKSAYERERNIILEMNPVLNTQYKK